MTRSQSARRLLRLRRDDALRHPAQLRSDRAAVARRAQGGGGRQRRRRDRRRRRGPRPADPPARPLVAAGAAARGLPGQRPHGGQPRAGPGLDLTQVPPLGALGAAAAAAAGDALGLARDPRRSSRRRFCLKCFAVALLSADRELA